MKEFIHKFRQVLKGTRVIENPSKYNILCGGCLGIHFVFTLMYSIAGVYPLAILNFVVTMFYGLLMITLVPHEKYKLLFILALLEVELNASVSSLLLGDGYEFMIYTLSLIPGAFYMAHTWPAEEKNIYGFSMLPVHASIMIGFMYVLVDVLYSFINPTFTGPRITQFKLVFHYFNILISVSVLLAFSVLFGLEVRYIQKLLNDENSRLGEIAAKDPLTKALNRRSFNNLLKEDIAKEENLQFCLLMLDIDDFKKVNDTHGHIMGDQVLEQVAETVRNCLRENDLFCRWGGEEFVIMVRGTVEECEIVAERVRKGVEQLLFDPYETRFKVTVTIGMTEYQRGLQIRTLIDMADQKLYYGKQHGKNQVVK